MKKFKGGPKLRNLGTSSIVCNCDTVFGNNATFLVIILEIIVRLFIVFIYTLFNDTTNSSNYIHLH
jgi:hypothetical protein